MPECIQRSAKEILGVSTGESRGLQGAWWWNKEVKEKLKVKYEAHNDL